MINIMNINFLMMTKMKIKFAYILIYIYIFISTKCFYLSLGIVKPENSNPPNDNVISVYTPQ